MPRGTDSQAKILLFLAVLNKNEFFFSLLARIAGSRVRERRSDRHDCRSFLRAEFKYGRDLRCRFNQWWFAMSIPNFSNTFLKELGSFQDLYLIRAESKLVKRVRAPTAPSTRRVPIRDPIVHGRRLGIPYRRKGHIFCFFRS